MKTVTIPRLPARLGYAGLIPFVSLSLALWWIPLEWRDGYVYALTSYAAVILSFMGAVHWGIGMLDIDSKGAWQLGLSVIPPLLAWTALLLPVAWSLFLLVIGFALLGLSDAYASHKKRVPDWYMRLRTPLTIVVVASLINAALAIF